MKSFKYIIFIAGQPVTSRFKENFYIDRLIKEDFKVEYWNLSALLKRPSMLNNQPGFVKQNNIYSYRELKKYIVEYKSDAIFIFDITYSAVAYKVFRIFSKEKCITSSFARGALPLSSSDQSATTKFLSKFKAFVNIPYLKKTMLNQCAVIARKLNFINPYTYVFYAGSRGFASIGYGYKYGLEKSILVPINSFDYDKYLLLKNKNCKPLSNFYCVFLDSYLPFHPDFIMLGLPRVSAESYYKSLNIFFDEIEEKFRIKVVIAVHPKSDYESKNWYGKREVIKNKTAELVQHAEFVLAHLSTSVSFAVLFKKPIVFIYNNAIKETYTYSQYPQIINFAKVLNSECINIDENRAYTLKIFPVNEVAYTKYKYDFLTNSESENELSGEIVMKTLKDGLPQNKHADKFQAN